MRLNVLNRMITFPICIWWNDNIEYTIQFVIEIKSCGLLATTQFRTHMNIFYFQKILVTNKISWINFYMWILYSTEAGPDILFEILENMYICTCRMYLCFKITYVRIHFDMPIFSRNNIARIKYAEYKRRLNALSSYPD